MCCFGISAAPIEAQAAKQPAGGEKPAAGEQSAGGDKAAADKAAARKDNAAPAARGCAHAAVH